MIDEYRLIEVKLGERWDIRLDLAWQIPLGIIEKPDGKWVQLLQKVWPY